MQQGNKLGEESLNESDNMHTDLCVNMVFSIQVLFDGGFFSCPFQGSKQTSCFMAGI